MRVRISRSATEDLLNGHEFYERQQQGVGGYFLDRGLPRRAHRGSGRGSRRSPDGMK